MRDRRRTGHAAGFTLIEVLVALGILAILLGVGVSSLLSSIRRSELTEGARAFAADLERARGSAQKQSLPASVTWSALAGQPITAYGLTRGAATQTRTPPARVKLVCVSMVGSACNQAAPRLLFTAPFAEASGGAVFQLTHSLSSSVPALYVKVGGVTGKVSISETSD